MAARGARAAASNAGAKPRRPSRPAFSLSDNAAYAKNGGFMRKPPEPRKSASTGKTAAPLGFVFVFVLRLDLLLLLAETMARCCPRIGPAIAVRPAPSVGERPADRRVGSYSLPQGIPARGVDNAGLGFRSPASTCLARRPTAGLMSDATLAFRPGQAASRCAGAHDASAVCSASIPVEFSNPQVAVPSPAPA